MKTGFTEHGQGSLNDIIYYWASVGGLVQLSVDYKSLYICGAGSLLLVHTKFIVREQFYLGPKCRHEQTRHVQKPFIGWTKGEKLKAL